MTTNTKVLYLSYLVPIGGNKRLFFEGVQEEVTIGSKIRVKVKV